MMGIKTELSIDVIIKVSTKVKKQKIHSRDCVN